MSQLTLACCILIPLLMVLIKWVRPAMISPVYVLILVYTATFGLGVGTYLLGGEWDFGSRGVTPDNAVEILGDVLFLIISFIAGVLVMSPSGPKISYVIRNTQISLSQAQAWSLLSVASVALLCSVLGTGVANVWSTSIYHAAVDRTALLRVSALLFWPSMFGLGVIAGQVRAAPKAIAWGLFALSWLVILAGASRKMAAFPVLFCVGMVLADSKSRLKRSLLTLAVILVPLLQITAIEFRQLPDQGMKGIPGLLRYMASTEPAVEFQKYLDNVLVPIRVTYKTKYALRSDPRAYLGFAFNPLPSLASDATIINTYAEEFITWFEPFNAIGEILYFGIALAAFYYFLVGMFFGYVEKQLRRKDYGPICVIQVCLCVAFIFFSLQYSLRTVNRFLYYSLALGIVSAVAKRNRRNSAVYTRFGRRPVHVGQTASR